MITFSNNVQSQTEIEDYQALWIVRNVATTTAYAVHSTQYTIHVRSLSSLRSSVYLWVNASLSITQMSVHAQQLLSERTCIVILLSTTNSSSTMLANLQFSFGTPFIYRIEEAIVITCPCCFREFYSFQYFGIVFTGLDISYFDWMPIRVPFTIRICQKISIVGEIVILHDNGTIGK